MNSPICSRLVLNDRAAALLPLARSLLRVSDREEHRCLIAQRVIGVKDGHTVLILGCGVSGLLNIEVAK